MELWFHFTSSAKKGGHDEGADVRPPTSSSPRKTPRVNPRFQHIKSTLPKKETHEEEKQRIAEYYARGE